MAILPRKTTLLNLLRSTTCSNLPKRTIEVAKQLAQSRYGFSIHDVTDIIKTNPEYKFGYIRIPGIDTPAYQYPQGETYKRYLQESITKIIIGYDKFINSRVPDLLDTLDIVHNNDEKNLDLVIQAIAFFEKSSPSYMSELWGISYIGRQREEIKSYVYESSDEWQDYVKEQGVPLFTPCCFIECDGKCLDSLVITENSSLDPYMYPSVKLLLKKYIAETGICDMIGQYIGRLAPSRSSFQYMLSWKMLSLGCKCPGYVRKKEVEHPSDEL